MYIILCYFLDTFTELLCQRLAKLLKEQHDSTIDPDTDQTEWLQDTAHCIEFILLSGTFRKAVNLRINNTVIPLLAELIACLDRNGNLELALHNNSVPECLSNLWHDISKDETLIVLHYQDTISPNTPQQRRRVPVLSDGVGGQYFKVHFPFSWIIYKISDQLVADNTEIWLFTTTHTNHRGTPRIGAVAYWGLPC